MRPSMLFSLPLLIILSAVVATTTAAQTHLPGTYLPFFSGDDRWRYLDDGSDQGTAWREPGFDDAGWARGPAELGYGDGDEATVISFGPDPGNKYITTYFRHNFVLPGPAPFERLALGLLKDDGAIVYLNGAEILRINMPDGAVNFRTTAVRSIGGASESTFFNIGLDPSLLRSGDNVVAVEVHQASGSSSDLSFDLTLAPVPALVAATPPRNIILFIGDGMGPEQLRAAGLFQNGAAGTLLLESLPHATFMSTYSADDEVTDSAASATAMATGQKVNNGVIAMQIPGDGSELATSLEYYRARCKEVGLVTTTYVTHATPAAFGAHEPSRGNRGQIAADYLNQSRPHVLLGGGAHGMSPGAATAAGYTVVTDRTQLFALPATTAFVSGQFGGDHLPYEYDYATGADSGYDTLPHLTEMVTATLGLLEDAPEGFFLVVEGGRIDHAGHANEIERNIFETLEFDRAVGATLAWADGRDDTLILVTADHETGGLAVVANNGSGNFPDVTWSTTGHTAVQVPLFGWGHNAELVAGVVDNRDLSVLARAGNPPLAPACAAGQAVPTILPTPTGPVYWPLIVLALLLVIPAAFIWQARLDPA